MAPGLLTLIPIGLNGTQPLPGLVRVERQTIWPWPFRTASTASFIFDRSMSFGVRAEIWVVLSRMLASHFQLVSAASKAPLAPRTTRRKVRWLSAWNEPRSALVGP